MKLSQLELIVASMRAQAGASADPSVDFWVLNRAALVDVMRGPTAFVEFDLDASADNIQAHKVVTEGVRALGDYSLPINVLTPR